MRSERARRAAAAFKRERRRLRKIKGKWPARDENYLRFIRSLPCCVCRIGEISQFWPTEAAHVGDDKGMSQKCSDYETLPLCSKLHHQEGPHSHHKIPGGPPAFFRFWGLDRDSLIAEYQERYQAEKWGRTIGEMDLHAEAALRG